MILDGLIAQQGRYGCTSLLYRSDLEGSFKPHVMHEEAFKVESRRTFNNLITLRSCFHSLPVWHHNFIHHAYSVGKPFHKALNPLNSPASVIHLTNLLSL
jgi:hypothetical protein